MLLELYFIVVWVVNLVMVVVFFIFVGLSKVIMLLCFRMLCLMIGIWLEIKFNNVFYVLGGGVFFGI